MYNTDSTDMLATKGPNILKGVSKKSDVQREHEFTKWRWNLMSRRKEIPERMMRANVFYKNHAKNFCYKDFSTSQIQFETIDALKDQFAHKKRVFIIGAGPSLNKNIDEFCKNFKREWGIVVATDSSVHELSSRGFKPDFVMSSEGDSKETAAVTVPTTEDILDPDHFDREFYKDVPLIAASWCNHLFVSMWPCDDVYYYANFDQRYEQYTLFNDRFWPNAQPWDFPRLEPRVSMVGFHAVALAEYFKSEEIVVLGFDCCTYPKCPECGSRNPERIQERKETIKCECGFEGLGETIHHTENFNMDWDNKNINLKASYEAHLMWFLARYNCSFGVKTINCTEGGALTESMTDCKEMTLADKFSELSKG